MLVNVLYVKSNVAITSCKVDIFMPSPLVFSLGQGLYGTPTFPYQLTNILYVFEINIEIHKNKSVFKDLAWFRGPRATWSYNPSKRPRYKNIKTPW